MGANIRGFDLSHHQGSISADAWQQAAEAGFSFAIVKATEGLTFTDGQFAANVQNALAAGFVVAAYHFMHADQDGGDQAQFFLNTIAPFAGHLGGVLADGISLPPAAMDLEQVTDAADWPTVDLATRIARVGHFLDAVDANFGAMTLVYTAPGWFDDTFQGADWSGHPLWIAAPNVAQPPTCGAWAAPFCWQYSWTGDVPGIGSGTIDLDVIFDPN
jgi:GH25 family lysozyme M1 (1,4-beta-N-acetylmuramidase)